MGLILKYKLCGAMEIYTHLIGEMEILDKFVWYNGNPRYICVVQGESYTHLYGTMEILYKCVWSNGNPIQSCVVQWKSYAGYTFVWYNGNPIIQVCVIQWRSYNTSLCDTMEIP